MLLLGSLHSLSLVHDKTINSWAMAAKWGNYSEETLREAVRLVQDEGYSYREVFKLTGIPRTTIHKYAKSNRPLIDANVSQPGFLQQGSLIDARLSINQCRGVP